VTDDRSPPRSLHFRTRGRVDAEPLRRILAEGRALVADHGWWCGAPVLDEEQKSPTKARGRILGEVALRFGWEGAPASERPPEDDAFMALRDAAFLVERLRRWSEEHAVRWELALPDGAAEIAEGRVDPTIVAWLGDGAVDGTSRAEALLLRHVDRHRGIEAQPWSSVGLVARKEHVASLARRIPLDAADSAEIRALRDEIALRRDCGQVWFGVWEARSGAERDPRALADRTTTALGLGVVGPRWQALSRAEAIAILVCVLRADMAYRTPLMSDEQAAEVGVRFLALFAEDAQLFTNAHWHDGQIRGWYDAVAGATFEGGVVAVSATRTGILWVGDED
jgi:hypothetical protein